MLQSLSNGTLRSAQQVIALIGKAGMLCKVVGKAGMLCKVASNVENKECLNLLSIL